MPYLGRGKQSDTLKAHLEKHYPEGKADLATAFTLRCLEFCADNSSTTLVTPQNWLFLPAYTAARTELLANNRLDLIVRLGANAFRDMNFWAATTALSVFTASRPADAHAVFGIDASGSKEHSYKEEVLRSGVEGVTMFFEQRSQLLNPDARISMETPSAHDRLGTVALTPQGTKTGDDSRLRRNWWEFDKLGSRWRFLHGAPDATRPVDGASYAVDFREGESGFARPQGQAAWGKRGVIVKLMGGITAAGYFGEIYDSNVTAVVPKKPSNLPAVWTFVDSPAFEESLRAIEQAVKINNATVGKVPFDVAHWQKVAAEKYPHGLPKPFSSDPTQWLFNGHPKGSDQPLHVAVARLLGYQWPRQTGSSFPDCPALDPDGLEKLADANGIVCLSASKGEAPAAERLRGLLVRALGDFDLNALIASAGPKGSKSRTLEAWLRDEFFDQHCEIFHNRPFIWHIWDGQKGGFSALVNYHQLNHANLENLTYAYFGDWIRRQQAAVDAGEAGSDARLQAAKQLQSRLKLILEGEPPYDLFVRWKPLPKQAIGWHPDINDGVRINIRPIATADILRKRVKIKWDKDRGKEPVRDKKEFPWFWGWDEGKQDFAGVGEEPDGNRWNDCHYTNEFKQRANKA